MTKPEEIARTQAFHFNYGVRVGRREAFEEMAEHDEEQAATLRKAANALAERGHAHCTNGYWVKFELGHEWHEARAAECRRRAKEE